MRAGAAQLDDDVRLPATVRRSLDRTRSARDRVERDQRVASDATRRTARLLTDDLGLSVRDAAELVGLSHQRIQQLTGSAASMREA